MTALDSATFPARIAKLPRDPRGYPIPRFVEWVDGKPDFRSTSVEHWKRCAKHRVCWICGDQCGRFLAYVSGPGISFNYGNFKNSVTEPAEECWQETPQWKKRIK